jgi:hypothetical protein
MYFDYLHLLWRSTFPEWKTVMKSLLPERKDFWRKTIKNFFSKNWERKSDETRLLNLVLRDMHTVMLYLFIMG